MRMRKKKNGEARLAACSELILPPVSSPMERPWEAMGKKSGPVFLEIGAGKGGFACEMANRNPDASYFAMERVSDCVVLGAELAKATKDRRTDNLRFVVDTADNLVNIFADGTVDRIFLNFSDPWSKKGYAKRRLTHKRYLAVYLNLLKDGGVLRFKTDNVGLFDFSLEEIEELGLKCNAVTRDLHNSPYNEGNVMTEYETAFSNAGMAINMLEIIKPEGFKIDIPEELGHGEKIFRGKAKDEQDAQ